MYVLFIVIPLQTGIFQVVAPPVVDLTLEDCMKFAHAITEDKTNRHAMCMPYKPVKKTAT